MDSGVCLGVVVATLVVRGFLQGKPQSLLADWNGAHGMEIGQGWRVSGSQGNSSPRSSRHLFEWNLAGYELESERYLIVVGRKPLRVSELIRKGGVLYQVMPLILDPPTPSLVARTLAASK